MPSAASLHPTPQGADPCRATRTPHEPTPSPNYARFSRQAPPCILSSATPTPRTQRHTISAFRLSAGEALCIDFWAMRALDLAHDHTHDGMRVTAYGSDIVGRLASLLHGERGALRHINL